MDALLARIEAIEKLASELEIPMSERNTINKKAQDFANNFLENLPN